MQFLVCAFFLGQLLLFNSAHAQEIRTVTVCNDPAPPKAVVEKGKQTDDFFTYLIKASFARIGVTAVFITDYPFIRCLSEVENEKIDFVMGAYYDSDRAKIYDYSDHYYTLTPQVFYLASNPVVINNVSDLKRYRGCGIYGSSYLHYALNAKDLDLGPGYDSMFRKLHAKRCDYFVEELEVIRLLDGMGRNYINDPSIKHSNVPGAAAPSRYLITARNSKASHYLSKFNKALGEVMNSTQTREIWQKENGNLSYTR